MVQRREKRSFKTAFQALPSSPFIMLVRILCCSNFYVKITNNCEILFLKHNSYFFEDICSIFSLSLAFQKQEIQVLFTSLELKCFVLS